MVLVWVRNEQWWFFISKTVLSSSKIPKLIFLITWGSKSSKFLLLYDVNWPEKFNHDNELVAKNLTGVVLADFRKKNSFWGPYLPSYYFSLVLLTFLRQDASSKHPYDYILNHDFLTQKLVKLVVNQKNHHNRLNHSFLHEGSSSIFLFDEYSKS